MLASSTTGARPPAATELVVEPHCGADGFLDRITIGEKNIDLPRGEDGLFNRLKAALGKDRPNIRIIGDPHTPYRCIGGVIFYFQRLGVRKVVFITASNQPD